MTNGDLDARLSFDAPVGHLPLEEDIATLAEKAMEAITEAQGEGWRFMSRDQFVQDQLSKRAGAPSSIRFAVPHGDFSHKWARPTTRPV